jgi:hypothetical protein
VVEAERQQPTAVGAACQHGTPAWASTQVQRGTHGVAGEGFLGTCIGQHAIVQFQRRQRVRVDTLAHTPVVVGLEGGAQDLVACGDGLQRLGHELHLQRAANSKYTGNVVGAFVATHLGQQPQTALRQR